MTQINTYSGKKKLLSIYATGIAAMLGIAYFSAPYSILRVGCDAGTGLIECLQQEPKLLFLLFMMPAFLTLIAMFTLLISVKNPEKDAISSNMPKIIKMHIFMTIFFVIGSLLMFAVSYLPKEVVRENVDLFKSGWFAFTALLLLYTANITGKMNKSLFSGWPTPWNQKSELAWEKSQRFVGFTLSIISIIGMFVAFIWVDLFMYYIIGGIILSYTGCAVVSYYVYKSETNQNS
ncbi:MAG: SdpI family protein [Rhizobiales bacterium]|nr:SdpI family protein [Hyphomicrobiales bacterium]NRB12932.1 SdpI family protein [Hyphomicrobiales bacterium]